MHKFTIIFSSIVKPLVSEEKDKYLSLASIEEIGKYIPEVGKENVDLLPVAFNACVVNRANKNGDVIDSSIASRIYKNFINKPIDVEHDRKKIIGVILTAGFSEFGTDKPLSLEEIQDKKEPYNITLGGVIWKIADRGLADLIEESNDPTSENYLSVSASWELGYSEYEIAMVEGNEKNIENAKIISDPEEINKIKDCLKGLGGSGKLDSKASVYRKIIGEVVPLGIGLTASPAADVKGVLVKNDQAETEAEINKKAEEISQKLESNVMKERIDMKITEASQITDELLSEVKANVIRDFIAEELQKASEKYTSEIKQKEQILEEAVKKQSTLASEVEALKTEVEKAKNELNVLQTEKIQRENQEKFNERMASIDEQFELTDEDRQIICSDIKDLTDEAFSSYQKKMAVLMKEKSRASKASVAAKSEVKVEDKKQVENSEEVVAQAIENGEEQKEVIPNLPSPVSMSLKDKYKNAFSESGFVITK